MEALESHFHNWWGVLFFTAVYIVVLLFIPFYRKMDKKPTGTYIAFIIAFAIEMHGIPFSMYVISWIVGRTLPEGVLWGHTLVQYIGHWGMYIGIACSVIALLLILGGWRRIHRNYWSKQAGEGALVTTGIYRYIRHPQYTGLLLLSFGMLANWATLPLLLLFPVMVVLYVRLAKREEQDMLLEFGDAYRLYQQNTKMFIPFVV